MKKEKDILHPPKLGKFILTVGLSIYLISGLARDFYFDFDLINLTADEARLEWYLRLGRDLGFVATISSMIIFGIRSIRFYGKKIKRFVIPLIGVFICATLSFVGFYSSSTFAELQSALDNSKALQKIEQAMNKDQLSVQKESTMSKVYASTYYNKHGKQIKYLTSSENYILFEPSEEDKEFRVARHLIEWKKKSMYNSMYFWLIALSLSLLLGLLTPVGKTNPSFKQNV